MRIVFLRHAKAVGHDEAPSDRERALTDRGRREAALAGAAIQNAGLFPEVAMVSPAVRTRQTWTCAQTALLGEAREVVHDLIYEADADTLWDLLCNESGETRIVVGHNPTLLDLTAHLIERANDASAAARMARAELPTAAWAAFECEPASFDYVSPRLIAHWRPPRD
jgi:phosphohistidine phosphatase